MKGLQVDALRKLRSAGKVTKNSVLSRQVDSKRKTVEGEKDGPAKKKRTAFGDITNAVVNGTSKLTAKKVKQPSIRVKRLKPEEITKPTLESKPKKELLSVKSAPEPKKDPMFSDSLSWTDPDLNTPSSINSNLHTTVTPMPDENASPEIIKESEEKTIEEKIIQNVPVNHVWRESQPLSTRPFDVRDIDQDEDPCCVSEYVGSVFKVMKRKEDLYKLRRYLDDTSSSVTPQMRTILIDWLVEVQENFELHHETLYLAVKLLDHYLQRDSSIGREELQLVAASALFISCKLEERYAPPLDDFVFICDDAYKNEDFIKMEGKILMAIDYDLNIPLSYRFLRRYARIAATSMETLTLARYMLERSLHEHDFVDVKDSLIAASALNLAFQMTKGIHTWDNTLAYHSGYEENELKEIMQRLNTLLTNPPQKVIKTVINKYSHSVFFQVAKIKPLESFT